MPPYTEQQRNYWRESMRISVMRFGAADPPKVLGRVLWAMARGRALWTRWRVRSIPTGEKWVEFGAAGVDRSITALVLTER